MVITISKGPIGTILKGQSLLLSFPRSTAPFLGSIVMLFLVPFLAYGTNYTSAGSGNWNVTSTWNPSTGVPGSGDTVTIQTGNTVTITNASAACRAITITGIAAILRLNENYSLTIDDGGGITNTATFQIIPASGTNPVTITSPGTATYIGTNGIGWNSHQNIQLGGLVYTPAFTTGSAEFTLVGNLTCSNLLTINDDFDANGHSITANSGISITGSSAQLYSTAAYTINCNGGDLTISSTAATSVLKLPPGSALYFNPASDGQYGLIIKDYGQISATGTSSNRVIISSSTNYKTYILLDETTSTGSPAGLFRYCDISKIGCNTVNKYGITAKGIDGNDESGTAAEGLSISNCLIHDGYIGFYNTWTSAGYHANNYIYNNNIYNFTEAGIKILLTAYSTGWGHVIYGNTIHNISGGSGYGMHFAGGNSSSYYAYTANAITNTNIYNCTYGVYVQSGICGGTYTISQTFKDCNFGAQGLNLNGDVVVSGTGSSWMSGLILQNCQLASPTEVEASKLNSLDDRIVSYKHDNVPGLVRVWGDWRPLGISAVIKIRYDSELYSGSADANVQKVIEFGPGGSIPQTGTTAPYIAPAGKSRFRTPSTVQSGAGIEMVGITSPNWAPVLVRSVGGDTYCILIEGVALSPNNKFSAYACDFQNLNNGLLIYFNSALSKTTEGLTSLDYCSFRNNSGATRHLAVALGNLTDNRNGCSFDNSATYDVRVDLSVLGTATNITFTNYVNARANAADENEGINGTVTWSGIPTTKYAGSSMNWNTVAWSTNPAGPFPGIANPPTINENAVFTGNAKVTISSAPGTAVCSNLTINSGTSLGFNLSANRSLVLKNGGTLQNNGTISFTNASTSYTATLQTEVTTNPNMWIYQGTGTINWTPVSGSPLQVNIHNADWRNSFSLTGTEPVVTFTGNTTTEDVAINNTGKVVLGDGSTVSTWTAYGDVTVGASTAGALQLKPYSTLQINSASHGQYGLIVDTNGIITATGTSSGSRNCRITSVSSYRSYIHLKAGSQSTFKWCDIYNLGYNSSPKYGLVGEGISQKLYIYQSNIHHNYHGIYLNNCDNINSVNNWEIYSSNINYNNACGVYLTNGSDNNVIRSNTVEYNGTAGIILEGSSDNNLYAGNIRNNSQDGIRMINGSNNNFGGGYITGVGPSIYGNTRAGIYIGNTSYISGNTMDYCTFGAPTPNLYDVYVDFNNTVTGTLKLTYCSLASSPNVYWAQNSPGAGTYVVSYRHNRGYYNLRIWGDYVRSSGTENWNYTTNFPGSDDVFGGDPSEPNPKTITFDAGPSGLNSGRSRFRLNSNATLDMASGNSSPTNITTVQSAGGSSYYDFIISGTINADAYKFTGLASNGLEIDCPVISITSLANGQFANCQSTGQFLNFNNVSFGGSATINGCSFDNSTTYDVRTDIGAPNYITFTNFSNDNPDTKDNEVSGHVDWVSGVAYKADAMISTTGAPPWVTDNVYDSGLPPTQQVVTQTAAPSSVITYYVKIQNDSGLNIDSFSVTGTASAGGWFVTYYDITGTNITADIINTGTGYKVDSLATAGFDTIVLNIEYNQGLVAPGDINNFYVYVNSIGDQTKRDGVVCRAQAASYKPDLLSKKQGDVSWSFDGTYSSNPAIQNKDTLIDNNQIITYYYQIQNDGNSTANYSITADAGHVGNWWITYYEDVDKDEILDPGEITPLVITPTGWSTGSISAGGYKQLICEIKASPAQRGEGQVFHISDMYLLTNQIDTAQVTAQVTKVDALVSQDGTLSTWVGGNVYAPTDQITSTVTAGNTIVTYYVQLQNEASMSDSFSVTATGASGSGWYITYYDAASGGTPITSQITTPGTGWGTGSIGGGGNKNIRVNVLYNPVQVGVNQIKPITFYAWSTVGGFYYDAVAGQTTTASSKPDVLAKKAGDVYSFDGTYSSNPANQSLSVPVNNGEVVTYYYQIQNDGNYDTAGYTITADAGNLGKWWITYYNDPDGDDGQVDGSIIPTGTITPTGWFTSAIIKGSSKYIRVNLTVSGASVGTSQVFRLYGSNVPTSEIDTAQLTASVPTIDGMIAINYDSSPASSTWHTRGVYENILPTSQIVSQTTGGNIPVTYYMMLENSTGGAATISLTGTAGSSGWYITYYDAPTGGTDRTSSITGAGYQIPLAAGATSTVRFNIAYNPSLVGPNQVKNVYVYVNNLAGNPIDIVEGSTASASYKPDVLSKKAGDSYSFDNTYSSNPASQNLNATLRNGEVITYYYQIQNDGTYDTSGYSITADAGNLGKWWITYYDDPDGDDGQSDGAIIPSGTLTPTGWSTGGIVKGSSKYLRVNIYVNGASVGASQIFRLYDSNVPSREIDTAQITAQTLPGTDAMIAINYDASPTSNTWHTNDVYDNTLPTTQVVSQTASPNTVFTYYVMIQNDSFASDTVSITGTAGGSGWYITYYDAPTGGVNRTASITGAGYQIPLAAGATSTVRFNIAYNPSLVGTGQTKDVYVYANSTVMAGSKDIVKGATTSASCKTDLLISVDNNTYAGNDVYESTPTTVQTQQQYARDNETATYYVKIENDGNVADSFTVSYSSSLSGTGFSVNFYKLNDTPISLPWLTDPLSSGGSVVIKCLVKPNGLAVNTVVTVTVSAKSSSDQTKADAVAGATTVSGATILYPYSGKTVGPMPVLIGQANPSAEVKIYDNVSGQLVITTTSDVNGLYRVQITNLTAGPKTLRVEGALLSITVSATAPSTIPIINYPAENQLLIRTAKPTIIGRVDPVEAGKVITAMVNTNTGYNPLYDINMGTAIVQADGSFQVYLSKSLPRGMRKIVLICDGQVSDLRTVILVDPIGVLFDSLTNQAIDGLTVTLYRRIPITGTWEICPVDIGGGTPGTIGGPTPPLVPSNVTNPQVSGWTGRTGEYQFLLNQPAVSQAYEYKLIVTNSTGYTYPTSLPVYQVATSTIVGPTGIPQIPSFVNLFPSDPVTRTLYVDNNSPGLDRNFSVGGFFYMDNSETDGIWADVPLDASVNLLKITKKANKPEVSIGDIITYEIKIINDNSFAVKGIYIRDILPPGFKYIEKSTLVDNATKLTDPAAISNGRTRIFNVGDIPAHSTKIIRYQLVVGTGVAFGEYKNVAEAMYLNSRIVSNQAHEKVKVIPDPLFDYAVIIGKVFDDRNGNGVQDANEPGVAGVRIMTEDGILITTDQDGKYHIAGLKPQTKLLKIDWTSLPNGAEYTTPNPVLVRFTLGGHLEKVNFGVRLRQSASVLGRNLGKLIIKIKPDAEGNPVILIADQPIKLAFPPRAKSSEPEQEEEKRERAETKRIRVQINSDMLPLNENGEYEGEYTFQSNETSLLVWAQNKWGAEAETTYPVSVASLDVRIIRLDEKPTVVPELGLVLIPDVLSLRLGQLTEPAKFKISTSYPQFIKQWKIIIYEPVESGAWRDSTRENLLVSASDSDVMSISDNEQKITDNTTIVGQAGFSAGSEVPKGHQVFYEKIGNRIDISKEIIWDGYSTDKKHFIKQDMAYKYKLVVEGVDGKIDMTKEGQLIVVSDWAKSLQKTFKIKEPLRGLVPLAAIGPIPAANNIVTHGRVYLIKGTTDPKNKIVISTPNMPNIIEFEPFENGSFEKEVYIPVSETKILIDSWTPGLMRKVQAVEDIRVMEEKEHYLLLTGLGDIEIGGNSATGNLEAIKQNQRLSDGSYYMGRAAFFLKTKVSDYLITSSLDTDRKEKQLFRYIDPDKFYPFYGDSSTRQDVADNTQGMFYLKVERDMSNFIWGNYNTGFSGTELAQYNRTLYGARVELGQPFLSTTKATAFVAQAKQLANHNELRATGGSLYYLLDRYVIEGSEKVAIEVRDKNTGLTLSSTPMTEGEDYEIDYQNGRILFYKPIASVAASDLIISVDPLNGNSVYVIVDYEYDAWHGTNNGAQGARIIQPLNKDLTLGVTYVTEQKSLEDYKLMGTDLSVKLASYGQASAEYAKSESEGIPGFISYDGGLGFASLPTLQTDKGAAYKLNLSLDIGQLFTKISNEVLFAGYYQNIEKGFSSNQSVFQQGTTKYGTNVQAKLNQYDNLLIRYDGQRLEDNGNLASQVQMGASKTQLFNIQVIHTQDPLKLTGSYQYQTTTEPVTNPLLRDEASQMIAARLDYRVTKEWTLSVEQQGALTGKPNNQSTMGGNLKLTDKENLNLSLTMGTLGNSFLAGLTSQVDDKHSLYTNYQVSEDNQGNKSVSTIFGESKQVSTDTKIYREERFTGRAGAENSQYAGLMGLDHALNPYWSVGGSCEHSQIDNVNGSPISRDAASIGLAYNSYPKAKNPTGMKGYTLFNTRFEYRKDKGESDRTGFLSANKMYYQFNEDAALLGRANYSKTRNDTLNETEAEFTEATLGLAYRPVKFDKYNLLAKISYQTDRTPRLLEPMVSNLQTAVIYSLEGAIDFNQSFQGVGKVACKQAKEETGNHGSLTSTTYLIAPRINYKIKSDTDLLNNWLAGVEYRMLVSKLAEDKKAGFVLELDKEIAKYNGMGLNLGFGYNFTDFTDDLSIYNDDYKVNGWFVRLSTKF